MNRKATAKALESYGWAFVKLGQKIKTDSGQVMEKKWWQICQNRRPTALMRLNKYWGGRHFLAGMIPVEIRERVDVFYGGKIFYSMKPELAAHFNVIAWRIS